MRTRLIIGAAAIVVIAAAMAAVLLTRNSVSDPASARCDAPPASFGTEHVDTGAQTVDVHFTCNGARLAGSLYLPEGHGPHPAIVWVHGSGPTPRLFPGPLVNSFLDIGIAVFSYDKRGIGASGGRCCPGDEGGHFNLLIADASGAVEALRKRTDIDPKQLGFFGVSQAGWIVPRAAVRAHAAFTVLASGPAVTLGEEHEYSHFTGEEGGHASGLSRANILRKLHPSGFDQKPDLQRMTMPGLWLYGADDLSQPTELSVAVLRHLEQANGKDFTSVVFRNAGHGLLDGTGDPRVIEAMLKFVRRQVHVPR